MHSSDIEQVSDDAVNAAYNYFDAERMKYYNNVYVKLNRNFQRKKIEKPAEWEQFAAVVRICKRNNFHLRCYIKYCFINILVPKAKGKTLADIKYLRNYPQVIKYAKDKTRIEKLYKIYMAIVHSIMLVKKLNENNGDDSKTTIKKIVSSGRLAEYISTGTISPFFISLIHNAALFIKKNYDKQVDDRDMLFDLYNRMDSIKSEATNALTMFYPSAMNKSIIELCQ